MNKKKIIIVNGRDYDASGGVLIALMYVAQAHGGTLSDHLFNSVIQEMEEDEDKVMEQMAMSQSPKFDRFAEGWYVDGEDDE